MKAIKAFIRPKRLRFKALRFVGIILRTWPKDDRSSYSIDFFWWFYLLNYLVILFPIISAIQKHKSDLVMTSYSWLALSTILESSAILIYTKYQRQRLKLLIGVENQLRVKKPEIIKRYATYYTVIYIVILVCYSAVALIGIMKKPVASNDELILLAIYPFELKSAVLKIILDCHQVIILCHVAVIPNLDGIIVMLIFTCTERLKLLQYYFENVKNFDHLTRCIREHEHVLHLIKETNSIVRVVALKTVMSYMSCTVASGIHILNHTDAAQWIHQLFLLCLVYARIYLYSECAENMYSAVNDIESTIYLSNWENESVKMVKAKILIINRCQKLPVVNVNGFMNSLDRRYLCKILKTTYSTLMTLRAITGSR